jgi:hypothetical protein
MRADEPKGKSKFQQQEKAKEESFPPGQGRHCVQLPAKMQ